jgi:hypothetical protein
MRSRTYAALTVTSRHTTPSLRTRSERRIWCRRKDALAALMHDSAEAYVSDMTRPLKDLVGENYKQYERIAHQAICHRFNLCPIDPPSVTTADLQLLVTERRDFFQSPCRLAEVRAHREARLHHRSDDRGGR